MTQKEKIKKALNIGNEQYCPKCKKIQPVEITFYDPSCYIEEAKITCLVCSSKIRVITIG